MAVLTWVLLTLLVVAGFGFVALPLARGKRAARRESDKDRMRRERESALQLLRDLEHDHRTGKLDDEEYASQRAEAEGRAIEAMKGMDGMAGPEGDDPVERSIRRERAQLEKTEREVRR